MKSNNFWWGFIIVLILAFLAGMHFKQTPAGEIIKRDTIYKVKTDTFKVDSIVAKYTTITKLIRDTMRTTDSIPVVVQVPISTSFYDSLLVNNDDSIHFKAQISGYRTSLDSLWLTTRVKEKEVIVERYLKSKPPIFSYGIQAGAGYGLFNKKPDVYIGFGVSVNL